MLVVKIRQMAPLYEIKLQKPDVNKHTSLDVWNVVIFRVSKKTGHAYYAS